MTCSWDLIYNGRIWINMPIIEKKVVSGLETQGYSHLPNFIQKSLTQVKFQGSLSNFGHPEQPGHFGDVMSTGKLLSPQLPGLSIT
jgi:hypothetical protein